MPLEIEGPFQQQTGLNTLRSIGRNQNNLQRSLNQLATGQRDINGSTLAISERLRSQIRGLESAIDNSQNAQSLVNTADAAQAEITNLLGRVKSLSLQGLQTATSDPDAQAVIQAEIDSALDSIDRIANNTNFGSRQVFGGASSANVSEVQAENVDVQIDEANFSGSSRRVNVEVESASTRASVNLDLGSTGELSAEQTIEVRGNSGAAQVDLASGATGSEIADEVNRVADQTGVTASFNSTTNQLTFSSVEFGSGSTVQVSDVDANGDDLLTFTGTSTTSGNNGVVEGRLDATSNASVQTALEAATFGTTQFNSGTTNEGLFNAVRNAADEVQSIAASVASTAANEAINNGATTTAEIDTAVSTALTNSSELSTAFTNLQNANTALTTAEPGNAGIGAGATLNAVTASFQSSTTGVSDTDVANSFVINTDSLSSTGTSGTVRVNGVQTTSDNLTFDFNESGVSGSITLDENSNQAGFSTSFSINSQGALFQTGSGSTPSNRQSISFNSVSTTALGRGQVSNPNFNSDQAESSTNQRTVAASLADIRNGGSFSIANGANGIGSIIDRAISNVGSNRARLGSFSNSLQSNINSLNVSRGQLIESESRIRDVDVALQAAELTRTRGLLNSSINAAGQSNSLAQVTLQLLG